MRPFLLAFLFLLQTTTGGVTNRGGSTTQGSVNAIVPPPTMTYRWAGYNAANACGSTGASSCTTTGQPIFSEADLASSNLLSQPFAAGQPTYTTGAINGLPSATFNDSARLNFNLTTAIPSTQVGYTFYAVFKPIGTFVYPILGPASAGGLGFSYVGSSGLLSLDVIATTTIATSTTALATGSWYTVIATLDRSSHTYAFYHCSAGTTVADGAGSESGDSSISQPSGLLGDAAGNWFNGQIAEFGFLGSVSTTGICAWSQAKYAI